MVLNYTVAKNRERYQVTERLSVSSENFFAAELQHWIKKRKTSMDRYNSEILLHETHNAICYS